jgi:hypothetical protein
VEEGCIRATFWEAGKAASSDVEDFCVLVISIFSLSGFTTDGSGSQGLRASVATPAADAAATHGEDES